MLEKGIAPMKLKDKHYGWSGWLGWEWMVNENIPFHIWYRKWVCICGSFMGSFCPITLGTYLHISLLFHQHVYRRQLSNRSMFHAGRYLDDKEICYLWTVIVTANVCQSLWKLINTGHISAIMYDVLTKPCVFAIQSLDRHHWYP